MDRERRREREFNENQLEGRNAVLEVLRSGRDIEKVFVQKGNVEGTIKRIVAQAAEKGVLIQETSRQKLDEMSQTKNHQGVIALVSAHDYVEVEEMEPIMGELDILYMTRVQKERFFNEADYIRLKDTYILTPDKLEIAKKDMIVMHPLPRVNEISVAVDDDPRAMYFPQAKNGMFIRMALILKMLEVTV